MSSGPNYEAYGLAATFVATAAAFARWIIGYHWKIQAEQNELKNKQLEFDNAHKSCKADLVERNSEFWKAITELRGDVKTILHTVGRLEGKM